MKLEEKMQAVETALNFLATELGDHAVRRAILRWRRKANHRRFVATMEKREAEHRLRRLFRSVWLAAVPERGAG